MTLKHIALVLFGIILGSTYAGDSQHSVPKATCSVIGFTNDVDNEEWRDARVGMGVRSMLAQSLFETGLFALIEENPEIKVKIEEAARAAWLDKSGKALENAIVLGKQGGTTFIARGKLFHFGKPRTRASVGPAHFASDEVEIKIEVTLENCSDGKKLTAVGSGKAKTTASSGLFTYHGNDLDAEKSMVGTATKKAIDAAVEEIGKKYRKMYKIR